MDKFDDLYIKLETIDACFYALEKFITEVSNSRVSADSNRLEAFFYVVWDQLTAAKEEAGEAAKEDAKQKCQYIKQLEAENKALKAKLEANPFI